LRYTVWNASVTLTQGPPNQAYLFRVESEWTLAFAIGTVTNPDFLGRVLVERAEDSTTLPAVELDILELGEDATPPCHNTRYTDKVVKVRPTQVSQRRAEWEIGNAHMHFVMDAFVRREIDEDCVEGDFIEDFEHSGRRVGKKVSQNGLGKSKMEI
jgi:hypothetical protein